MRTDRRGFLRVLAGAVASLSAGASSERARDGVLEIHRATRNTLFGSVGPRQPKLRSPPAPFKPYPGQQRLALPRPRLEPQRALAESLERHADKRFKRDLGAFGRRQPPIMVGPRGIWAYTKMERKEGSK